jgi:hypothetical protein
MRSATIEPTKGSTPVFVVNRVRRKTTTAIPATALITPRTRRFGTAPCSHRPPKRQSDNCRNQKAFTLKFWSSRKMSFIATFQQELQDDYSLRLLFTDEFRLILGVFRYGKIVRELRDGRARWL